MKTKFFKKNKMTENRQTRRFAPAAYCHCLLLLFLCPALLSAQNGVTVTNLAMNAGTVTFEVSWKSTGMPTPWSDSVWVFVDYNDAGTMERLPLLPGATLTQTSAPGFARVERVSYNDQGVWIIGNARSAGSFSATVQLHTATATATATGACVYASNYPPVGEYISATNISFTGTPDYNLVLKNTENEMIYRRSGADFDIPAGYTLVSFTDATGAPGIMKCIPPATYTLQASALDFCTGSEGVQFALSGTENGRQYQLYRDNAKVGAVLDGAGSAATFSGSFNVAGAYTAKSVPTASICEGTMGGVHLITENPLPTITRSGGDASQTINMGTAISPITYTASNATIIALAGGSFPAGITGSPSGINFTISGTPSAGGTFSYAVRASHVNGCTSSLSSGTITVKSTTPPYAASTQTWTYGTLTWSDRIAYAPPHCTKVTTLTSASVPPAEFVERDYFYYNWPCVVANPAWFCPGPWRIPTGTDTDYLKTYIGTNPPAVWAPRSGQITSSSLGYTNNEYFWADYKCDTPPYGTTCEFGSNGYHLYCRSGNMATPVRCVK